MSLPTQLFLSVSTLFTETSSSLLSSSLSSAQYGPLIPPQELLLHLLTSLPVTSHTTVLGVFSALTDEVNEFLHNASTSAAAAAAAATSAAASVSVSAAGTAAGGGGAVAGKRVYLCLRGLHLVESISDALQFAIESISTAGA